MDSKVTLLLFFSRSGEDPNRTRTGMLAGRIPFNCEKGVKRE